MLPDVALELFAHQFSLIADHQLRRSLSEPERRAIRRHPDVERASPRVLRHRAGPVSLGQQLLLPVLDAGPGTILWGRSAAHWWGFGRYRALPVHVARRRTGTRAPRLARVHTTTTFDPERDVAQHRGIPIVRPERLLLWLSRELTCRYGHDIACDRLGKVLDHAWREGLVDGVRIHRMVERCGGRGNGGIVVLRRLLEDRSPDHRPTDSALEGRWEAVVGPLAQQFRRQVVVGGDAPIGRFDQVHRTRPLVVEIHSEKFHTMPSDVERDGERERALVAAGFAVVVYWEYDIWHDGLRVRRSLADILRQPDRPGVHRPTPPPTALLRTVPFTRHDHPVAGRVKGTG